MKLVKIIYKIHVKIGDSIEPKILRDEYYRCRICEHKCHKECNSYIQKITPKIHIRICRHCYLRINKYLGLVKKVKNENLS